MRDFQAFQVQVGDVLCDTHSHRKKNTNSITGTHTDISQREEKNN